MEAPPLVRVALAALHVLAGLALLGWSALLVLLAGFGFGASDVRYQFDLAPLPWVGLLALAWFARAWRMGGDARRVATSLAACSAAAALVGVATELAFPRCPTCGPAREWLPLAITLGSVWLTLGRLALAFPLLLAWQTRWRYPAGALFVAGIALGTVPSSAIAYDDVGNWLLAVVAVLATLALALIAIGVAVARRRIG